MTLRLRSYNPAQLIYIHNMLPLISGSKMLQKATRSFSSGLHNALGSHSGFLAQQCTSGNYSKNRKTRAYSEEAAELIIKPSKHPTLPSSHSPNTAKIDDKPRIQILPVQTTRCARITSPPAAPAKKDPPPQNLCAVIVVIIGSLSSASGKFGVAAEPPRWQL